MSDYKSIIGKPLKFVTTNLDNDQAEGQIWYNSTTGEFKDVIVNESWSSGGNAITARPAAGGFGIQTAAVMYGGGPSSKGDLTEEYNGTGFSTGGTLNTSRSTCQDNGWGVDSAGICASGNTPGGNTANVEEYNGSSWTEVNNVSTARRQQASIGLVQTAGAICGGFSTANTDATEEYDGTNWTSGGTLNTSRRGFTGAGTLTAGIVYSGVTTAITTAAEEYDGTSWTTSPSINTARNNGAGSTNAPQSTALLFGGNTGSDTGKTEKYDGTTWTETADMATARDAQSGSGTGTAALTAAGKTSVDVTNTEEFTRSTNVITGAAWASGGNLGTARYKISSANAAPQDAALAFGGRAASGDTARDLSEEYNGASWSEGNNLNNATRGAVGAGTQTAGLRAGGFDGGPAEQDNTEEYNGTSWSNANDMPANMRLGAGCGTQTAGLAFGGLSSPLNNKAVEYDGTNWTVGGTMNTGRNYLAGFGVQTAAVAAGGDSKDNTEEYNGTSWTSVNDVTSGNTQGAAGAGILTAGLFFGGTRTSVPENTNIALNYDGTNWSTTASMATARVALGGTSGGSNTAGLAFGGDAPPQTAATEEFTGETSALNIKTISTS